MQYLLAIIAAAILLWAGIFAYNQSASDRRMAEARAYAIEAQADADASATRWMATYPALMIVGGTIVGIVWGVGFALRARNSKPPQIVVYNPHALTPGATRAELQAIVEQYLQMQRSHRQELVDGECQRY